MIGRYWLAGEAVRAGNRTLVPLARGWQLRLPGGPAGGYWLRPVGVLVRQPEGHRSFVAVRDAGRWLEVALLAAGAVAFILLRRRPRAKGAMR